MRRKNKTAEERQDQILEFMKNFIDEKGYVPTVREIGDAVGLKSPSTVHGYLKQLENRGLIKRNPEKNRAIDIRQVDENIAMVKMPVVGTVAAGVPLLAEENIEEVVALPKSLIPTSSEELFMLHVRGDSMINAGILDGDMLVIKQQPNANNGEIVVALVDGESATVKRFYQEKDCIRLQPENDFMEPFYEKNVQILGKVVGLYRTF